MLLTHRHHSAKTKVSIGTCVLYRIIWFPFGANILHSAWISGVNDTTQWWNYWIENFSVPPSMLYDLCGQRLLCFRNYAMAVLPSSTCGNRVMFLCCYKFRSSGHGSWGSRSCLALFGDCLHCKDLRCRRLWPMHLHCLWQCSSLIATASEIVFWYVCNMQNLCFIELMVCNLFVYAICIGKNLLDDWFVHFILPHVINFRFILRDFWHQQFYGNCVSAVDACGGRVAECPTAPFHFGL
jgi:hypothetical protein